MELTEVTKFRRAVLTGLARFTWQGTLPEHIYDILYSVVTEDSPRVRCCVHKERAVLKNRINMALGLTVGLNIVEASKIALTEPVNKALPIIDVLPEACDQCPIDKFLVTDACRHCVAHKCMNKCPKKAITIHQNRAYICLLYTSDAADDLLCVDRGGRRIINKKKKRKRCALLSI